MADLNVKVSLHFITDAHETYFNDVKTITYMVIYEKMYHTALIILKLLSVVTYLNVFEQDFIRSNQSCLSGKRDMLP